MRELAKKHEQELRNNTNIDVDAVMKATYLHDFDRLVQ